MDLELSVLPFKGTGRRDRQTLMEELASLGFRVSGLEEADVPGQAFNQQRGQYNANMLLDQARLQNGRRVLAITDLDLYAGNLNFVFGLADLAGRAALISFYRLRFGADDAQFRTRALKEALHELGHTFGLRHCPNPRCVMTFSNTLADTDRKGKRFCRECARKLSDQGGARTHPPESP